MKLHRNRALLAALALGLVSGTVNAQIDLTPDTGTAFAPFMYAKESLQKADSFMGKGDNASTTYYRVTGAGTELDLTFDAGTRIGSADTGLLEITLTGMAFAASPTVTDFDIATGGMMGESTVLMRYVGSDPLAANAPVTIDLNAADAADVVGITDGHTGGVKVELINATLESVLGSGKARTMVMQPMAVKGVSGVMRAAAEMSPIARVSQEFMAFDEGGDHLAAGVGSLMIALPTMVPKNAADGADVTLDTLYDGTTSMVKLVGDLSFAKDVTLQTEEIMTDTECATDGTDWPIADDKMMTMGVVTTTFGTKQYICIEVKADTAIPEASYQLMIDYMRPAAGSDFVSPIMDETVNIGSIERDGTTIHIPFVSTYEGYNHRFMIVNNGPAATYEFMFKPEDGITAQGGAMASGDLPMGTTTHLKASDIVMLTGGSRTAATFTAVAQKKHIEMSSILATKANGATDLSILMAE